jgi:hypothetical protein
MRLSYGANLYQVFKEQYIFRRVSLPLASVAAPHPLASVTAPYPLASVSAPHPLASVAAPHPLASVAAPHPLASVAAPHPLASVAAPHPSRTESCSNIYLSVVKIKPFCTATKHCFLFLGKLTLHVSDGPDLLT